MTEHWITVTRTEFGDTADLVCSCGWNMTGVLDKFVLQFSAEHEKGALKSGDMLEDIFNRNSSFTELVVGANPRGIPFLRIKSEEFHLRAIVASLVELGEYAQESPYKWWGRGNWQLTPEVRAKLVEELIDEQHFIFVRAMVLGMTAQEFYKAYIKKNDENWRRFKEQIGWNQANP